MVSEQKLAANRRNAARSSGPKTAAGKARSRQNALRHGLAISVTRVPGASAEIAELAHVLAGNEADTAALFHAHSAAEAELDILRVSMARAAMVNQAITAETILQLAKYDRYERRAYSRRKRALRALEAAQSSWRG